MELSESCMLYMRDYQGAMWGEKHFAISRIVIKEQTHMWKMKGKGNAQRQNDLFDIVHDW